MFRGVSELSLDDKGRVAIPARHRDPLSLNGESNCVITIDTQEKCLLIYAYAEWQQIEEQISALPSFDPQARRIQRLLIGHATEVKIDSHGRLLIPGPLKAFAGLDKNAVLIGQGKKFELWDAKHWQSRRETWVNEEGDDTLPDSVLSISL
jgi:MraZ protein